MRKTVTLVIVILCSWSCDKQLLIEPQQAISTSSALSTEQGIRTALIGTFDLLGQGDRDAGDVILNTELLADTGDLFWTGFLLEVNQLLKKDIAINSVPVSNFWIQAYKTINQVNTVLAAIDNLNPADALLMAGQLRFIRGLVYFDLINLYGKAWTDGDPATNLGVPVVKNPAIQNIKDNQVARNTVEEVHAFILEDLLFARDNLRKQNGIFANAFAASALLSRVYLMREEFALAESEADRIISGGAFVLQADIGQVFNLSENSGEDIFAIQITAQSGNNRISYYYSSELAGGGGFIGIGDDHLALYENGDLRSELFYADQLDSTRRTSKWLLSSSNHGNITMFRLAEMYLTRAECRFRAGDLEGAKDDVNVIRERAGLQPYSISEITLASILRERYIELIFEGHQFRDLKRNRKAFGDLPFDSPRLIYPIPQREMEINKALVQNEGY